MKPSNKKKVFTRRRNRPVRTRKRNNLLNKLPPPDTKRIQTLGAGSLLSRITIQYSYQFNASSTEDPTPNVISLGNYLDSSPEFTDNKYNFKYYKILAIKIIKFPYNSNTTLTHFNVYIDWGARNTNYTYEYMNNADTVKRIPMYSMRVLNYKFRPPNANLPTSSTAANYINLRNFKTAYDNFTIPINLVVVPIKLIYTNSLQTTISFTIEILVHFRGNEYLSNSQAIQNKINLIQDEKTLNEIKEKLDEKLKRTKENKCKLKYEKQKLKQKEQEKKIEEIKEVTNYIKQEDVNKMKQAIKLKEKNITKKQLKNEIIKSEEEEEKESSEENLQKFKQL